MVNIALIILYIMTAISLLIFANRHGKPRDNYNFWDLVISGIIEWVLIWWALGWRFI